MLMKESLKIIRMRIKHIMEVMGRGLKQIIQESPQYFHLMTKYTGWKLFKRRSPIFGSADIINVCNLHCDHCYWWTNRKESDELTLEQWKEVIDEKFKKQHVFAVTVIGGNDETRCCQIICKRIS